MHARDQCSIFSTGGKITPILHFSLWWVWSTTLILISCLPPRRAPEPPWMETPSTSLSAKVLLTLPTTQMYIWCTSPLLRDDPIHDIDRNGLQPQARGLPTQDRHHVPTGRGTQPRACVSLREKSHACFIIWDEDERWLSLGIKPSIFGMD